MFVFVSRDVQFLQMLRMLHKLVLHSLTDFLIKLDELKFQRLKTIVWLREL